MEDIKLKPCPFCGSTARVWAKWRCEFYCIECDNEECGCVYGDDMQLSFEEVIELWNKRAEAENNSFAEWVAEEIFSPYWEFNSDAFAEFACRKLAKLGIVKSDGDKWVWLRGLRNDTDQL